MDAAPGPGTVLRYAYLWAGEREQGKVEAVKDRPTLVVAVTIAEEDGRSTVLVVAITHSPPKSPSDAVPFPAGVKRQVGLDDEPAWIVTTEANYFDWPGPDIRFIPGRTPATSIYGRIPTSLLQRVAKSLVENRHMQRMRMISRE